MAITLDTLRKTVKKNKGKSQALAWLADMERESGDYEAALKTVDEALAASPTDVPAMLVRAKILAGQQDYAGSVMEYKKVLAKDPFCLSAHKRMGEAYDQLGKTTERNACFRRVHDMDPLDSFWKEEYDVLPEEQESDLMAPPMDDSSFTMDMGSDAENAGGEEDNIFANLASSMPNADDEDNSSMDDLMRSLNSASGENADDESVTQDPTYGGNDVLSTSEVSSAITGILGGDDDLDSAEGSGTAASPFSASKAPAVDSTPKSDETEFSLDAPAEAESQPTNVDDAFSSIFGDDELPEEQSAETSSLGEWSPSPASAESEEFVETPKEEDKPTNVDDAFSSIFGDDDLPEEKPAEASDSLSDWSPSATPAAETAESLETPKEEDKETNVDDAFSSIFGDDDLPEEKPVEETLAAKTDAPVEESSSEESFGGLFEKSADAEFSLGETSAETLSENSNKVSEDSSIPSSHMDFSDDEVASIDAPKEENKETNVDDAFSSIFGDDDLPEEKPVDVSSESAGAEKESVDEFQVLDNTAGLNFDEPEAASSTMAAEETPETAEKSLEESVEDSFGSLFEKSADADFSLDGPAEAEPVMDAPAFEEPVAETPVAEVPAKSEVSEPVAENVQASASETVESEKPAASEDLSDSVDGAFDALFENESSDEIPEEETLDFSEPAADFAEAPSAEAAPADELQAAPLQTEDFSLNNDSLELPSETSETAEAPKDENIADEMGGAFASMFGNEDDLSLPEEKEQPAEAEKVAEEPAEVALSQEATSAAIEEESVKDSVDGSFDSLFGEDEDLPEENAKPAKAASVAPAAQAEKAPAVEKSSEAPSAELDSIDSEVSNAFKGLFDEDDTLSESDEPSNKGVDYLMSGDSDDEVAASLVNNADAPLSRGAADLDDSLNTRTLADIYMEQGVYNKALEIYEDLAKKDPDNAEIKTRLEEIEKLCREKFGEA